MPDLSQRMAKFTEGQVTWPALVNDKHCTDCRHYQREKADRGRCGLVQKMHKFRGATFVGSRALACSMFKGDA